MSIHNLQEPSFCQFGLISCFINIRPPPIPTIHDHCTVHFPFICGNVVILNKCVNVTYWEKHFQRRWVYEKAFLGQQPAHFQVSLLPGHRALPLWRNPSSVRGLFSCRGNLVPLDAWWRWSSRSSTVPPTAPWACCQNQHLLKPVNGIRGNDRCPLKGRVWCGRGAWVPPTRSGKVQVLSLPSWTKWTWWSLRDGPRSKRKDTRYLFVQIFATNRPVETLTVPPL